MCCLTYSGRQRRHQFALLQAQCCHCVAGGLIKSFFSHYEKLEDYSLLKFVPMDKSDERSVEIVLAHVDHCTQFGEDADVRVPRVCESVLALVTHQDDDADDGGQDQEDE